jgi:hypothetical protein
LLTPQSSALTPVHEIHTEGKATANAKRRRNPTVARYLGLGASNEPDLLERDAKLQEGPVSPLHEFVRKRRRLNNEITGKENTAKINTCNKEASNQRRVSEGFRVSKPQSKTAATSKKSASGAPYPHGNASDLNSDVYFTYGCLPSHSLERQSFKLAHSISAKRILRNPDSNTSQGTVVATSNDRLENTVYSGLNTNDYDTVELDQSDWPQSQSNDPILGNENFDDDLNDDELLRFTSNMEDMEDRNAITSDLPCNPSIARVGHGIASNPGSSTTMPFIPDTGVGHDQHRKKKFNSPITLTTRLLVATGDLASANARKPIVRPPFPTTVRDRSPIIGLTSTSMLRTCFRIGEAINQAHQASKSGKHIVFELYARILDSERDDSKQQFTFCDLFHAKPPYIKGVYEAALWKSVPLFKYDSARLLQQGRICRCMGKMQREGKEWAMTVLNIWEATWDDVRWVEGIFNS